MIAHPRLTRGTACFWGGQARKTAPTAPVRTPAVIREPLHWKICPKENTT